jgi:hypothetical protein
MGHMDNNKVYCNICKIPMFVYKMKHNGIDEIVYRCMNPHGNRKLKNGKMVWANGGKQSVGVEQIFKYLTK